MRFMFMAFHWGQTAMQGVLLTDRYVEFLEWKEGRPTQLDTVPEKPVEGITLMTKPRQALDRDTVSLLFDLWVAGVPFDGNIGTALVKKFDKERSY